MNRQIRINTPNDRRVADSSQLVRVPHQLVLSRAKAAERLVAHWHLGLLRSTVGWRVSTVANRKPKDRLTILLEPRVSNSIEPERTKAVLKRLLRDFDLRAVECRRAKATECSE